MNDRKFRLNVRVAVFSLLCFVLFIKLGFWQLGREEEKRQLLEANSRLAASDPITAAELGEDSRSGTPVILSGRYLPNPSLLLDNIVLKGRVGFEVLHLFQDEGGFLFLVNRGFVGMGKTRGTRVDIPVISEGHSAIRGKIYVGGGPPLGLEADPLVAGDFPSIVQKIDIRALENIIGEDIHPHILRLNEGETGALPRYWPEVVMGPEKHRGYAIQWFMMAFAVIAAWFFFSFPKVNLTDEVIS